MGWVTVIAKVVLEFFKGIFGTKKPLKTTVSHPEPDLKVDDGKDKDEHLKDLGL